MQQRTEVQGGRLQDWGLLFNSVTTYYITHNARGYQHGGEGGRAATIALDMNVNRIKVGKDGL